MNRIPNHEACPYYNRDKLTCTRPGCLFLTECKAKETKHKEK